MRITGIETTPLSLLNRQAYHWSRGAPLGKDVVLVEVHTDEGVSGYGESIADVGAEAVIGLIRHVTPLVVGQSAFDIETVTTNAKRAAKLDRTPRFANHALAGIELALWDAIGKATGQPVHDLLGGALRDEIDYFAFLQGGSPTELAAHARDAVADGYEVFYLKAGLGEERDLANLRTVRAAIGERRLRIDPNEVWDPLTAIRLINRFAEFGLDFVEQPTPSGAVTTLLQVKESVRTPIAADQCAYTLADVFEICSLHAADVIVIGVHETGGLLGLKKAAAIAEAAGLDICIQGQQESGITTCASNQIAAAIPNLCDGNQIMSQLLEEDVIASPDLTVRGGKLPVLEGPGLGFELDRDAVNRAAERYRLEGPLRPFPSA